MSDASSNPRRPDAVVLLPWVVVALGEVWFGLQGFTRPSVSQAAMEVGALAVLGLSQARFVPTGPGRSPILAGILVPFLTVMILLPLGWVGVLARLGLLGVVAAAVVASEQRRPWGVVAGVIVALLGAAFGRGVVIARAGTEATQMASLFTADTWRTVAEEAAGAWAWPAPPQTTSPPIVIISIDTLRWDAAKDMSSFQRLAEGGASWEQAMSTSSWTLSSLASMLTGREVAEHKAAVAVDGAPQGIEAEVDTLAEVLGAEGYRSVALVSNGWLTHELGVADGFDLFLSTYERFPHRLLVGGFPSEMAVHDGATVMQEAIRWVERAPETGWFLWVHIVDPHLPFLHETDPKTASLSDHGLRGGLRLDADVQASVKAAYGREVAYADAQVQRLLDALERKGVLDTGTVVLTADHGEEFWDHGATGHGHAHHHEVVNIPLVIRSPSMAPGPRTDLASIRDVGTTLAAIAGTSLGNGHDLREPAPADRIVRSQGNIYFWQQQAARSATHKAIQRADGSHRVCYDLVADPLELSPIDCAQAPDVVQAASSMGVLDVNQRRELREEALKELGYIE